ncbi:OmpA family protein [Maribacter sp. MMG018]|uniref:OmpA family protein n=1 Tax=Maribacter sp. MMG018 TaxID=2822688 RepID=UPI001B3853FD|nr:OmpA family protein [Maribacter sp. MMG018]MBQ4914272.1 OmpA family protein [Maribacter sp. MMG018]
MVFGFLLLNHVGNAQNLIENPSFENYIQCPQTLGNLKKDLVDWNVPTLGSTDYFNGCSQAMGTPKNFNGEQPADFGVGYVGLYLYAPDDYREYLQGTLTKTLKKDEVYRLSFYVSLAERSDFAIREFGICFSEVPIQVQTTKTLSKMHLSKVPGDVSNYLEIKYDDFYSDEKEWVKVEIEFVAKGTENYLVIGNFKDNKRTRRFKTKRSGTKGSYYYLDMVSLYAPLADTEDEQTFELNKEHTFKNVLFDFDDYDLLPSAVDELEEILRYLSVNTDLKINISGHTDNIGDESYNLFLSRKRARAVAVYMMGKGISKERISYQGLGSSQPISTNKTAMGRHKNRRVAFVIKAP